MRSLRAFLLIVPALLGFTLLAHAQSESHDDARLAIAKEVMDEMSAGKMGSVCERFSVNLKDAVSEDKLEFVWNRLLQRSGMFQKQISQSTRTAHGVSIYISKSQFENSKVELRLMFNDGDEITRISITPVSDLSPETMEESAKTVADLLRQKDFDRLFAKFDDDLKADMTPDPLNMSWSHVISHLGEFKSIKLAEKDPEFDMVDVTCVFEHGEAIVRVAFDPYGKVSGLWLLPAESEPTNNPQI